MIAILLRFLGEAVGINTNTVTPDKARFEKEKVPYCGGEHSVGVEFSFSAELEPGVPKYWLKEVDTSAPNNRKFPERQTVPRCLTRTRYTVVRKSVDST